MRHKRYFIFLTCVVVAIWLVAPQMASTDDLQGKGAKTPPKTTTGKAAGNMPIAPEKVTRILPKPTANPNLVGQKDLDGALFMEEEFFGGTTQVRRPYKEARAKVAELMAKYPQDGRLPVMAATLDERLENFDQAAKEMETYAQIQNNSPLALRKLANFYYRRGLFKNSIDTLEQLATKVTPLEQEIVYRKIIGIVRDNQVAGLAPSTFYEKMIAANKDNVEIVKSYIEELKVKQDYATALQVTNNYKDKYPNDLAYFLKTQASLYEAQKDRNQAEAVYTKAFDPLWPSNISSDYYELLRRFGRYRTYRRGLQDQWTNQANFETLTRLFNLYSYEGNQLAATNLLSQYETRHGKDGQWSRSELETVAGLYLSLSQYDVASRYLYTLYLNGGLKSGSSEREQSLFRIFKVLVDANSQPVRLSNGDLSLYRDIATIDQSPGLLNGVLSLILANQNVANNFSSKEQSASGYFNRAFAYRIFQNFKQEYASSQKLPVMYQDLLTIFSGFGEHQTVVELGLQFQKQFPQAANYDEVTIKLADAYQALQKRDEERAVLIKLLDRTATRAKGHALLPNSRLLGVDAKTQALVTGVVDEVIRDIESFSDNYAPGTTGEYDIGEKSEDYSGVVSSGDQTSKTSYSSILERIVSSYKSDQQKDILKFFWGEIKKHSQEEGLYERMLTWLESANIVNEELKVYTTAIEHFPDNNWYEKLARWYIRNKKRKEFEKYSKEVIEILDQDDIEPYLAEFAQFSAKNNTDINYDSKLYFQLYSYAADRFPKNMLFIKGLLRYYETQKDWNNWRSLALKYYFDDKEIRDAVLKYLASTGELKDLYAKAYKQANSSQVYQIFTADSAIALSHFDEAVATYRNLVANYPGEPQYALRLADLSRSLSYKDAGLAEQSAAIYLKLARIYPNNHEYKTKAGEVLADISEFGRAKAAWDSILTNEKGIANTYLEVASIYWDYYQYDDAIRTIQDYRTTTKDTTALAYKLGAIYEGKNQWPAAIKEYVSVLAEGNFGRDKVITRLSQLAPRSNYGQIIDNAYQQQAKDKPDNWLLTIGYTEYLRNIDRDNEADALLRDQASRRNDIDFLEAVKDIFRKQRLANDEEQTLKRLQQIARDEREALKYRLQLAAFYEQKQQMDRATQIFDQLVANYGSNLGVIQEATQYYNRAGLADKSIALFKQTIGRAQGDYKRQFTLQLAQRLQTANRGAEAEQLVRSWYQEHPSDNEFFGVLTKLLAAANKQDALIALYQNELQELTKTPASSDEITNKILDIRLAMIQMLTKLDRPSEVIDQYIEIINRRPDDKPLIQASYRYAQEHNQPERLIKYYEDLAKKAYKNYRWNLVLAALYSISGDEPKELDQYKLAIVNEPERLDLREHLALLYTNQRRYDEAVAALQKNYQIDSNPEWLEKIAKVDIRAGKPDAAVASLRDSINRRKVSATLLFDAGSLLVEGGYSKQGLDFYKEAIALVRKQPTKETLTNTNIARYSLALMRQQSPQIVFDDLAGMWAEFSAKAGVKAGAVPPSPENAEESEGDSASDPTTYAYKNLTTELGNFLRQDFGRQVLDTASVTDRGVLAERLKAATKKGSQPLDLLLAIASSAGLTEIQEALLIQIKDQEASNKDINVYNTALGNLISFYDGLGMYSQAAETLVGEKKKGRFSDKTDNLSAYINFYNQMADYFHKAGQLDRELAILQEYYQTRSGQVTNNNDILVARYLNLLVSEKQTDQLQKLCQQSNPYQLQLINFLLANRKKDLALIAVQNTNLSPAWRASRRAQVGLYFQDAGAEIGQTFRTVLNIKPIKALIKHPTSKDDLEPNDWYNVATNYGVWLNLTPNNSKQANQYLAAILENSPGAASAHLALAQYYIKQKAYSSAEEQLAMATEQEPNSLAIKVTQGSYYFARGDRQKAQETWNSIIAKRRAGLAEYQSYLAVMVSHQLTSEALPVVSRFLSRALPQISEDEMSPLVRDLMVAANRDTQTSATAAKLLYDVVRDNADNTTLAEMLLKEDLISATDVKTALYRVLIERYSDKVLASSLSSGYDSSSDTNVEQLDNCQRRFINLLIARRDYELALREIKSLQDNRQDLSIEKEPEWLLMAQAVIKLRTNHVDEAVAQLRRYSGLTKTIGEETTTTNDRYLKAYALLINEQQIAAAQQLLYDNYKERIGLGQGSISDYAGIVGIEFDRQKSAEALVWLNQMVNTLGSIEALTEAARLATHNGLYPEALTWRQRVAQQTTNQTNSLEIARLQALTGQGTTAVETLKQLIDSREVSNSTRTTAIALLPQLVKQDSNLLAATLASYQARNDYNSRLVSAGLLMASNQNDAARTLLTELAQPATAAQARYLLATLDINTQNANAQNSLLKAIYADGKGEVAQALAFDMDLPKLTLIKLCLAKQQVAAALSLGSSITANTSLANALELTEGGIIEQRGENEPLQSFNYKSLDVSKQPVKTSMLNELAFERQRNTELKTLTTLVDVALKGEDLAQAIAFLNVYQSRLARIDEIALIEQKKAQLEAQLVEKGRVPAGLRLDIQASQSVLELVSENGKDGQN